jgi:hypothetical protein
MPISHQNQTLDATQIPPPSPLTIIATTSILMSSLQIKPPISRKANGLTIGKRITSKRDL